MYPGGGQVNSSCSVRYAGAPSPGYTSDVGDWCSIQGRVLLAVLVPNFHTPVPQCPLQTPGGAARQGIPAVHPVPAPPKPSLGRRANQSLPISENIQIWGP